MTLKQFIAVNTQPYLEICVYLNTEITKNGITVHPLLTFPVDYTANRDKCNLTLLHYLADDCKAKIRFMSAFHSETYSRTRIDLTITITDPQMILDTNIDRFYRVNTRG